MAEESQYTLAVEVEESVSPHGGMLTINLITQPLPLNDGASIFEEDRHPFDFLDEEKKGDSRGGVYNDLVVADNAVTRAILDTLQDEEKIKAASGHVDWRHYRATLVSVLDDLWD